MVKIVPKTRTAQAHWRSVLPVHPAAQLLPRMSDAELLELGEDIKKHGLHVPIAIFTDQEGTEKLLDGISRLDAMESVGLPIVKDGSELNADFVQTQNIAGNVDPFIYVISTNIRRRHLNAEQRQGLVIEIIARAPGKSDRQIGKEIGVDHKTISRARAKGEDVGRIPHVETRTDSKGREQPAKKSRPPKAEQKVFENPQEARAVVEALEVEEEETPIAFLNEFNKFNEHFTTFLAWCGDEANWPSLNPGRQKRRAKAIGKLHSAWSELVDLACTKPARRGRPPKAERAGAEA
jgi:ParB-like chromosome segregation protein Spo0J